MSSTSWRDHGLYREYVRIPYVRGTVPVLSPAEFLLALRRGKAVKRQQQHAKRAGTAVAARRRRGTRPETA